MRTADIEDRRPEALVRRFELMAKAAYADGVT